MIDWNSRWKDFLIGQGAVLDDAGVRHFSQTDAHSQNRCAADGDIIVDLSHLALIRAEGAEAATFLQGQLSNDILKLNAGNNQLSAYCDPKGRVLALFRIFVRDQAYYLQLPAALLPSTLNRLKMFVMRAKLMLGSADRDFIRIGLSGPNAPRLLGDIIPALSLGVDESRQHRGITVLRLSGAFPRFELIADRDTAQRLWLTLSAQASPVGASAWSWLDIAAGLPTILPGTSGEFIPQMLNLDLLAGLSFQKGCYPGQEIVARVQHRGRITHRLYIAHHDSAVRPAPGSPIYGAVSEQAIGRVVDAQPAPTVGMDLSAVIALESPTTTTRLGSPQGLLLTLEKPAYFQSLT